MAKSPVLVVKEKFGDKSKLVEAVKAFVTEDLWVNRLNADKGLERVSNAKLLRLHRVFSAVKAEFGSREKLVDSILSFDKRDKDLGLRSRLNAYPVPRLYDMYKSAKKRSDADAKAAKAAKPSLEVHPGGGSTTHPAARRGCRRRSRPAKNRR